MSKTALITGATVGIGYELAKCFAADKHDLVLVARNEAKLREAADQFNKDHGVQVRVVPEDLSDPGAPQRIFDTLERDGVAIEYLVNNAGFGTNGPFLDTELGSQAGMIEVNVMSLVKLTHLFARGMRARRSGRIMNVASTAAFTPGPMMAVYCATKSFVLSFSEALSNELRGTGVTCSCVCPGATATEFQARAKMDSVPLVQDRGKMMTAAEVARLAYRGFMNGDRIVVTGLANKAMAVFAQLAPRGFVVVAARKFLESRPERAGTRA